MKLSYVVPYINRWEPVEGELLANIAPHLAHIATFAVSRGACEDSLWWMVSNLETGRFAAYDVKKAVAIRKAKEKLATVSVEYMQQRIRSVRQKDRALYVHGEGMK